MKRLAMTNFGLRHPWITFLLALAVTGGFLVQFPKVAFDNDPENMLAESEAVRVFHRDVKKRFELYDFVIVGIVNEEHEDGVFNVDTLGRVDDLTQALMSLHRTDEGRPAVTFPARAGEPERTVVPELRPAGAFRRILAKAFRHDAEDLFTPDGASVIIGREIISPSVVDNLRQAELGQLKIEYLMETPPASREEALAIRDDALGNPLYRGTLVSEDGRALCLYLPLVEKRYSYNVASLVETLTADWDGPEQIFITGLPVAEDTFGVEMLVQMATSAPLAGLAIFLLLLLFFRRLSLVMAPMIVAMISVIWAMGLLIGLGFPVHIMSSMIAIFLMPIAVADSVHILSEFFDTYHRFGNREETVRHVIRHLFMPMLYTSLTTIAGFGSLVATPIPPVQVFGAHVAFGVAVAWLLSMLLVPAYILLFVPERALQGLREPSAGRHTGPLDPFLEKLGGFSYRRWKAILVGMMFIGVGAGWGVSLIQVNDNPVRWFTPNHRIRVADRVLNDHFGGTYTAYLTLESAARRGVTCHEVVSQLRVAADARFADTAPSALARFHQELDRVEAQYRNAATADPQKYFVDLVDRTRAIDAAATRDWEMLAEEINYLDPAGLTVARLGDALSAIPEVAPQVTAQLLIRLNPTPDRSGAELQNAALLICDEFTALSLSEFVYEMQAEITAPFFKRPDVLAYVRALQQHLSANPVVGKTNSAVDALMKANYELHFVDDPAAFERNRGFFDIPPSPAGVGQVFTQLEGMKKKDSLFHLVTRDYGEANLWIQLKSGDNKDMLAVVADVNQFLSDQPPPEPLHAGWAGLTYLNVIWQDKMVTGMLTSLGGSFVVVLAMMIVLFRSPLYGTLSMIPLSITILVIYGLIGITGKDYDMPAAVLSALTLGLSVDFAIHFLQRARELQQHSGSWAEAIRQLFKEPAMAISRNAIVISVGFTPLLVAPLVPYRTVGFFLATIMAVSWLATLLLLAAMVTMLQRYLFRASELTPVT